MKYQTKSISANAVTPRPPDDLVECYRDADSVICNGSCANTSLTCAQRIEDKMSQTRKMFELISSGRDRNKNV